MKATAIDASATKGDAGFGRQATVPLPLAALQKLLTHAFRQETAVADDAEQSRLFAIHVAGNSRLTPAEQVDIYRRQFWLRHEEVLEEDFPGLVAVLGEHVWQKLALSFLTAHPPHQPNLRDLGAGLPNHLDAFAGIPAALLPLARDMAAYELAFVDVFDGLDPPALDAELLTSLSPSAWERARLELSPVVRRMHFDYPVHRLRLAARDAKTNGTALPLPERRDVFLALFRKDLVVHFEELEHDAFVLLEALGSGATLLAACAKIAEEKTEAEAQTAIVKIGEWFRIWARNGFIANVIVEPAAP